MAVGVEMEQGHQACGDATPTVQYQESSHVRSEGLASFSPGASPLTPEQFGFDLPYGRGSERNTVSEPLRVSRVADLSSTQKVGHADAGKIAYFHVPHLETVATRQEIGVRKTRDRDVDPLAAIGRPSKSLIRVLVGMTDPRPQSIAIRSRCECSPRVANQAIALERSERNVASSQRISDEIQA